MRTPSKLSDRLQALIRDGEIPLSDAWGKLIDDLMVVEEREPVAWLWTHPRGERDVSLVHPNDDENAEDSILSGWSFQPLIIDAQAITRESPSILSDEEDRAAFLKAFTKRADV